MSMEFPDELLAEIDRIRVVEDRTRSNMVRVLLREALAARASKAKHPLLAMRDLPSLG